ncbi:MAG: PilZ domain-containing protein [Lachnospiraceae bacterium]|nr:PilZ domain-containing protein [Lachnospiraceae bacterium]
MHLQELTEGEKVTLEVVWGGVTYPLSTIAYRVREEGVWIKALYKNGQLLDFSNKAFKSAQFNLYAFTGNGHERIVWKNINIELRKAKENYYYVLSVSVYARESLEANRRENDRVAVLVEGTLITTYGEAYSVVLKDISNSGIGFYMQENLDLVAQPFEISFSDETRGIKYDIKVKCLGARRVEMDGRYLVGCRITSGPKNLLYYIYYKMMEAKVGEELVLAQENADIKEPLQRVSTGMHFITNRK